MKQDIKYVSATWAVCKTLLPLTGGSITQGTVTYVKNKVLSCTSTYLGRDHDEQTIIIIAPVVERRSLEYNFASTRLYKGVLSYHNTDLLWRELCPLAVGRRLHSSFQLKKSIHVISGQTLFSTSDELGRVKSSDAYDMVKETWTRGTDMPYNINIMVDNEDDCAYIIGKKFYP